MSESIIDLDIDEAIQRVGSPNHRAFLNRIRENHGFARMTVTETTDTFEVTVSHPGDQGETGGAEQYVIDKVTGEATMKWHEHPMPFEPVEIDVVEDGLENEGGDCDEF